MSSVPPGIPDSFPRPDVSAPRQHRIPLVWLLPAIVIVVGLFVVIHAKLAEGPVIEIRFRSAEGLEPGKTRIKFKDVDVGQVTDMRVSKDRTQVIVTAAMTKDASDYLVTDTKFWVVRPRVSGGSVSGLGTLLSGAYIGVDVGKADHRAHEFVGLEVPPIVTSGLPGREFVLHASAIGSLSVGFTNLLSPPGGRPNRCLLTRSWWCQCDDESLRQGALRPIRHGCDKILAGKRH